MSERIETGADLLVVENLKAWYGDSRALQRIDLRVRSGQIATLVGRNGAGKTTTLRAIMGLVAREGSIRFQGRELVGLLPDAIARCGIAYCPEERGIFPGLTTEENLMLPPVLRPGGMSTAEVYSLFPNLHERRRSMGTRLSGGEQQMLAIGRILRIGAQLLLLDEPTEGLAPIIVEQIGVAIQALKARGFTILLVEQNLDFAQEISDAFWMIEDGQVVDQMDRTGVVDEAALSQFRKHLSL